ncbi:MAG: hypothetical protein LKG11_06465 [Bacilli bacterium]|jgi:predicted cobalt transporter CbtA|nr:hypothetical protein [Bacilli bacterium]
MSPKPILRVGLVFVAVAFLSLLIDLVLYATNALTSLGQGIYWGCVGAAFLVAVLIEETFYRKKHPEPKQ